MSVIILSSSGGGGTPPAVPPPPPPPPPAPPQPPPIPPCPVITVTPATLAVGIIGNPYTQQMAASGGAVPYGFDISGGAIPPGLSFSATGLLSGTPVTSMVANFSVRATDANHCQGSITTSLSIQPVPPPPPPPPPPPVMITIAPASLPWGQVGAAYSQALTASGGASPYSFSVVAGTLPTGIALSTGGALSGTPSSAQTLSFTVQATDANGRNGTRTETFVVQPIGPPPPGGVLTQSDLTFDGWIRAPVGGHTDSAQGTITGRLVGGNPHLLLWKKWVTSSTPGTPFTGVIEIDVTGLTPTSSISTAPRATLYADWGDVSHGNVQSWDASGNALISSPNNVLPGGLCVEPGTNNLISSYIVSYGSMDYFYNALLTSLDSVTGTTGHSTFQGGPWRFQATAQYLNAPRKGNRSVWFDANPLDGTMVLGGSGYANPNRAWGPNLYGGLAFPTNSTSGGYNSTPLVPTKEFLDYYPPLYGTVTPNYFDAWTGQSLNYATGTPTATIAQFSWPSRLVTYPFLKDASSGIRSNPLLSGRGSYSDNSGTSYVGWFNGAHKRGVIFLLAVDGSDNGQTDPTQCNGSASPAALSSYLNAGNGWMHFSSYAGAWNAFDQIKGNASGATGYLTQTGYLAPHGAVEWQQSPVGIDFVVGETLTNLTTSATAVIDEFHRNDKFVGGCPCNSAPSADLCATGPSTTWQVPLLVIYDPAALANVAANTATDYLTLPTTYIDLLAAPYSMTAIRHNNPLGPAGPGVAGGWIDSTNKKMYIVFRQNDTTASLFEDVIARFSISDAP